MNEIRDLEKKIVNETDKILFREVIECLNSKVYRAGYILSWINIVESLKRKINDLANIGDIQSQQCLAKIESLEKSEKSADLQIIQEALSVSLLEIDEYKKLQFFWSQRCLFAHPYEKAPNEDELIFIIKQSIEITLCKKLQFKKNYINELVENLVTKPHFLSNETVAIALYAKNIIPRISKQLHSYFYKVIIAKIGEIKDDETKKIFLKRLRIFSAILLKSTDDKLSEDKWRMNDLALNHTYEFVLGSCDYRVWKKLPSRSRDIVLEYVVQKNNHRERHLSSKIVSYVYKKNLFTKSENSKFEQLISELDIAEASDFYKDSDSLSERLILEFDSGNFYRQQDSLYVLKSEFGQEFQEKNLQSYSIAIGLRIVEAAKQGCWEAQAVLGNIQYRFSDDFKIGFIVGLFVDNKINFNFADRILSQNFGYLNECPISFLLTAEEYIRNNKPDESDIMTEYRIPSFETLIERWEASNKYRIETIDFLKSVVQIYK